MRKYIKIFILTISSIMIAKAFPLNKVNAALDSSDTAIFFTVYSSKAEDKQSVSRKNELLSKIINTDQTYENYNVEVITDDVNNDGNTEYFYIFTKKGTSKKDSLNYCADIWFGNNNGVSRIVKWKYIVPDTYGTIELAGKKYFRYDLSYVTDSQTTLLGFKNNKCRKSFVAKGYADINQNKKEFAVLCSSYDMVTSKSDGITTGHTWKNYYFYIDDKGFHEYGARKISKNEFLKYSDTASILRKIDQEFKKKGNKVTYTFLKRRNGLVNINIICSSDDCITRYYKTYKVTKAKKLFVVESAEGNYLLAVDKNLAVY